MRDACTTHLLTLHPGDWVEIDANRGPRVWGWRRRRRRRRALDSGAIHQWPSVCSTRTGRAVLRQPNPSHWLVTPDKETSPAPLKDNSLLPLYINLRLSLCYCIGNNAVERCDWSEGLGDFHIVHRVHLECCGCPSRGHDLTNQQNKSATGSRACLSRARGHDYTRINISLYMCWNVFLICCAAIMGNGVILLTERIQLIFFGNSSLTQNPNRIAWNLTGATGSKRGFLQFI